MATKEAGRGSLPVLVIGGGYLGIQAASLLRRQDRRVVLLDGGERFGGNAWLRHANQRTSRLQAESATYALDFENEDGAALTAPSHAFSGDPYPSTEKVLNHLESFANAEGLAACAKFNSWVEKVELCRTATGKHYDVVYRVGNSRATCTIAVDAVMAFPGRLGKPNDFQFPGEENFQGSIIAGYGHKDDFSHEWAHKHVVIVGHGAFAIENVRLALDRGAAKVTIVCRRRYFVAPRIVSWLINARVDGLSRREMYRIGAIAYRAVGQTAPQFSQSASSGLAPPGLTPISDEYFAGFAAGRLNVVESTVDRVTKVGLVARREEIACDIIIKCLGFSVDSSIDRVLGVREMNGLWVNGDNRLMIYREGIHNENVDRRDAFNLGPFGKRAIHTGIYVLDKPELLRSVRDKLPIAYTASDFGSAHSGQSISSISAIAPSLQSTLSDVMYRKSCATRHVHQIEDFFKYCVDCWAKYETTGTHTYPYSLQQFMSHSRANHNIATLGSGGSWRTI
jgi:thioredoxin reductase